jgi:putative transposase
MRIGCNSNKGATFGHFFQTLDYIVEKTGAVVISQKPAYTSMVLSYRNEIIFTDCSIRDYWDEQNSLMVDRLILMLRLT